AVLVLRSRRMHRGAGRDVASLDVEGAWRVERRRRLEVARGERGHLGTLRLDVVKAAARAAGLDGASVLQVDGEGHVAALRPPACGTAHGRPVARGGRDQRQGENRNKEK